MIYLTARVSSFSEDFQSKDGGITNQPLHIWAWERTLDTSLVKMAKVMF